MLSKALLGLCFVGGIAAHCSLIFTRSAGNGNASRTAIKALPACATFHGTYEGTSVYRIDESDCDASEAPQDWLHTLDSGSIVPNDMHFGMDTSAGDILMHVQPARTQHAMKTTAGAWIQSMEEHMAASLSRNIGKEQPAAHSHQQVLAQPASGQPRLVHLDSQEQSAFYAFPKSFLPRIDSVFPSDAVLVAVSQHPLPPPYSAAEKAPQWLLDSLRDVHYSPLVDAILQDVNPRTIEKDVVRHLTAEDGHSQWRSRHSFTEDGRRAGQWIKDLVEKETGITCQYHEHDEGFSPNVICQFKGAVHPEELVIVGAHYDSRGTFGHVRAPGGDDDASGVSALLSLARIFKSFNIQFKRTVVLAFFSGEEQGLWGSRAYAKLLKEENKNVRLMLQADMIGYHAPGEPMQLALPDQHDTIEARWLVGNLSMTFVPHLQVGTTPACCSDHQSFDQQGFVSTWVFERNGPIADPKYHNSGDVSDREGYDFEQIAAIARVMVSCGKYQDLDTPQGQV